MNDRYALEARKLGVKVTQQATHIDIQAAQIEDLKRAVRQCNEIIDEMRHAKHELEKFIRFAKEYYPGSIEQYHAIKKLEDSE